MAPWQFVPRRASCSNPAIGVRPTCSTYSAPVWRTSSHLRMPRKVRRHLPRSANPSGRANKSAAPAIEASGRSPFELHSIMTTIIKESDLIQAIADAVQFISYYHPADYIQHLARAYEREESPAAKDAIAQILTNSRMCAEGKRPICQDTGVVNVFLKI